MESPTSTAHDRHNDRDHNDPPTSPPLHRASQTFTNLTSSALNYFTEPISYTFSGISRRISNDDAPTPLARALSADNLRLRELLTLVAQDLERIACEERYAAHVKPLLERAMRIRRHLHGP